MFYMVCVCVCVCVCVRERERERVRACVRMRVRVCVCMSAWGENFTTKIQKSHLTTKKKLKIQDMWPRFTKLLWFKMLPQNMVYHKTKQNDYQIIWLTWKLTIAPLKRMLTLQSLQQCVTRMGRGPRCGCWQFGRLRSSFWLGGLW